MLVSCVFFFLVGCSCFVICGVFPLLGLVCVLFFFYVGHCGFEWRDVEFDGIRCFLMVGFGFFMGFDLIY